MPEAARAETTPLTSACSADPAAGSVVGDAVNTASSSPDPAEAHQMLAGLSVAHPGAAAVPVEGSPTPSDWGAASTAAAVSPTAARRTSVRWRRAPLMHENVR